MKQVPDIKALLIGDGKMANHWSHHCEGINWPLARWSRSKDTEAELKTQLKTVQIVFLAISDDALIPFFKSHLQSFSGETVHFSGALFHPKMTGCHPLMSFGNALYPEETLKAIPLVFDRSESLFLKDDRLPNPVFMIRPENKPLYHSLCVMAANFPQWLWRSTLAKFSDLGIPKEALTMLIQQSLLNSMEDPIRNLTGPMVRNDLRTMEKHLEALDGTPEFDLYNAFIKYASHIAPRPQNQKEEITYADL